MSPQALVLKNEGNALFAKKDYAAAESCYSRALVLDPSFTSLYTNRAMCRLNLSLPDGVVADCTACLALDPQNVKANYYMSKALFQLSDHDGACAHAKLAYEHAEDKSLEMTYSWLLTCKSTRWKALEKRRRREASELESEVLAMLEEKRDQDMQRGYDVVLWEESNKRIQDVKAVFDRARKEDDRERKVPDWMIDDISFNVMVDPVIVSLPRKKRRKLTDIFKDKVRPIIRALIHYSRCQRQRCRPNNKRAAHKRRAAAKSYVKSGL